MKVIEEECRDMKRLPGACGERQKEACRCEIYFGGRIDRTNGLCMGIKVKTNKKEFLDFGTD